MAESGQKHWLIPVSILPDAKHNAVQLFKDFPFSRAGVVESGEDAGLMIQLASYLMSHGFECQLDGTEIPVPGAENYPFSAAFHTALK